MIIMRANTVLKIKRINKLMYKNRSNMLYVQIIASLWQYATTLNTPKLMDKLKGLVKHNQNIWKVIP